MRSLALSQRFSVLLLAMLFFFGCTSRPGEKKTGLFSNFFSLSDNEDKAIKEIIGLYGGKCEYGIKKSVELGKNNTTTFWLKFSESATMDSLEPVAELPASNMAYIFYKNLDKEKHNYHLVRTETVFSDGQIMGFEYTPSQLETVKAKMPILNNIVRLIKARNFEGLKEHINIDTTLVRFDIDEFITKVRQAEEHFGDPVEFIPFGFKFMTAPNGKDILHISGLITRAQQNSRISVDLDPASRDEKIYTLNYKF